MSSALLQAGSTAWLTAAQPGHFCSPGLFGPKLIVSERVCVTYQGIGSCGRRLSARAAGFNL